MTEQQRRRYLCSLYMWQMDMLIADDRDHCDNSGRYFVYFCIYSAYHRTYDDLVANL